MYNYIGITFHVIPAMIDYYYYVFCFEIKLLILLEASYFGFFAQVTLLVYCYVKIRPLFKQIEY